MVDTGARVEELEEEVKKLRLLVQKRETEVQESRAEVDRLVSEDRDALLTKTSEDKPVGSHNTPSQPQVLYLTQGRKLDRFKGKQERLSDLTVEEWIEDAEAAMASRRLGEEESAAFLLEHLAGQARREILGRGNAVQRNAKEILKTLAKVFGDGCTLPQLQQRFYGYKQVDGEDLTACSLELVRLFDRITEMDSSFAPSREAQLKSRLAEAVRDDGMKMELRRLASDRPDLSFFDTRDHVLELIGRRDKKARRDVTMQEVNAAGNGTQDSLKQQADQIAAQQRQIQSLLTLLSKPGQSAAPRRPFTNNGPRRCWNCNQLGHFKRDCPLQGSTPDAPTQAPQQTNSTNPSQSN